MGERDRPQKANGDCGLPSIDPAIPMIWTQANAPSPLAVTSADSLGDMNSYAMRMSRVLWPGHKQGRISAVPLRVLASALAARTARTSDRVAADFRRPTCHIRLAIPRNVVI